MLQEISRYIPKKYIGEIECVTIQPDFNYATNRSCQLYTIYLKNGDIVHSYTVKDIAKKLRKAKER